MVLTRIILTDLSHSNSKIPPSVLLAIPQLKKTGDRGPAAAEVAVLAVKTEQISHNLPLGSIDLVNDQ